MGCTHINSLPSWGRILHFLFFSQKNHKLRPGKLHTPILDKTGPYSQKRPPSWICECKQMWQKLPNLWCWKLPTYQFYIDRSIITKLVHHLGSANLNLWILTKNRTPRILLHTYFESNHNHKICKISRSRHLEFGNFGILEKKTESPSPKTPTFQFWIESDYNRKTHPKYWSHHFVFSLTKYRNALSQIKWGLISNRKF